MSLAQDLIKVNNLQLAAKLVSDQVVLGLHNSKRSGTGAEFEQYRHYRPGDDPKSIDWKLFARTEKHTSKRIGHRKYAHHKFYHRPFGFNELYRK